MCKNMHTCVPLTTWCLYVRVCDDLLSGCCIQSPQVVTAGHVQRCWWLPSCTCSPLSPSLSFSLLTEGISCEQMLAGSLIHNNCSDVFVWVDRHHSVHCSRCEMIGWDFPRTSHKWVRFQRLIYRPDEGDAKWFGSEKNSYPVVLLVIIN